MQQRVDRTLGERAVAELIHVVQQVVLVIGQTEAHRTVSKRHPVAVIQTRPAARREHLRSRETPATYTGVRFSGSTPMSLFLVCGFVVANLAVIDACEERRAGNARLALLASLTAPAGAVAVAVARPWGIWW